LTAFLAALSLFFFGGEVIHDFAFALVIGIAVGTYSSVFVASPIVAILESGAGKAKA
jgi:preprotein translocase subunit SecF